MGENIDIIESYKMLLESEEELLKIKDKAFEEADIEGKLRFLKSEIDSLNRARQFEISQKMQMLSMQNTLSGFGMTLF